MLYDGANLLGVLGIARDGVEIDHRIVGFAGANPLVHRPAQCFAFLGVIGRARIGRQRGADRLDAVHVRALDDLLMRGDQILGRHRIGRGRPRADPDIVDALHHDDPFHAGLAEHVAVEAGQRGNPGAIAQQAVSRNALIDDRQIRRGS